jgi:hypothetical protein
MEVTGQELIKHFKESCRKLNKLFIPDSPRQEAVADALAEFYSKNDLFTAVDLFIKSKTGPFLIFDFAIESKSYVDKSKFESKAVDNFNAIVEQTRKRMESE